MDRYFWREIANDWLPLLVLLALAAVTIGVEWWAAARGYAVLGGVLLIPALVAQVNTWRSLIDGERRMAAMVRGFDAEMRATAAHWDAMIERMRP